MLDFPARLDPKIAPYFNNFMVLLKLYCAEDQYFHPAGARIILEEADAKNDAGYCVAEGSTFKISIHGAYWDTLTPNLKQILINHEAFHCMLGVDHTDLPKQIMNPTIQRLSKTQILSQTIQILIEQCGVTVPNGQIDPQQIPWIEK